jgi:hypothetical protein
VGDANAWDLNLDLQGHDPVSFADGGVCPAQSPRLYDLPGWEFSAPRKSTEKTAWSWAVSARYAPGRNWSARCGPLGQPSEVQQLT